MKHKLAIEPALTPIKEYLSEKGYQVDSMSTYGDSSNIHGKYDAYIVTGMNSNLMGISDTSTKAVVINAQGLTPEQVYHELQMRLE